MGIFGSPGHKLLTWDIDNFEMDELDDPEPYQHVSNCIEDLEESLPSLFLSGPVGTGKTHLCVSIYNAIEDLCNKRGWLLPRRLWFFTPDLRERVYREINKTHIPFPVSDQCKKADILFLDDLGRENTSEFFVDRLNAIIDHRYTHELATVINTNEDMSELIDKYGQPMVSRITEMCDCFRVEGDDYRLVNHGG